MARSAKQSKAAADLDVPPRPAGDPPPAGAAHPSIPPEAAPENLPTNGPSPCRAAVAHSDPAPPPGPSGPPARPYGIAHLRDVLNLSKNVDLETLCQEAAIRLREALDRESDRYPGRWSNRPWNRY